MLRKEDITYPISFVSFGVGTFTFTSENEGYLTGIREGGRREVGRSVGEFIAKTNKYNPENNPATDYSYLMMSMSVENKSGECKAEDMPIGATLTGVMLDDESWEELRITPRRIEVDLDVITFLLHTHYSPNTKQSRFAGEVSMNRDAMIRWEKS